MGEKPDTHPGFAVVRVVMHVSVPGASHWTFTSEPMSEDFAIVLAYELRQVYFKAESSRIVPVDEPIL